MQNYKKCMNAQKLIVKFTLCMPAFVAFCKCGHKQTPIESFPFRSTQRIVQPKGPLDLQL